jgi:excisionase family DNA binding protein
MSGDRESGFPKLLSIEEVAEILGLSTRTVRRLIAKGELTVCYFGRAVRAHPDDLARYIDRHRGHRSPEAIRGRLSPCQE